MWIHTALAAKRIAQTETVIIAFDGHRVPNFVRYGTLLLKCSLYRKQVDVCHACGRLGHRTDVCPTPSDVVCRGCGLPNPDEQHQCTPICKFCGGPHLTASKECAHRFKTPYIVRRRRFERARQQEELPPQSILRSSYSQASCIPSPRGKRRSRSRGRSMSRRGSKAALPQDHDHHRLLQRAPAPEAAPRPAPGAARPTGQDPTPPPVVKASPI
ncbi:hypothetical protein HPB51_009426 [Rhipicephalus microplus]|uniref:CCHC-type domain-containing protein n=1 Tax=Rhipicephalus microplus TaxID=6941 RepID=A0A9J6DZP4_RHIMP|nr:hypothetical protein HPB51_009426 [Rhipicephalus microplus]